MSKDFQSDKKTILVIDDDIEIIELLKMFLDLEGYAVVSSANGMDGIKMAESNNSIDLVILDVGLPDISGQQVCKIIRQKTDIPIIMLSANDSVSDKVICLEYGADDYITKPFENMELMARIKAVLRRFESNHELLDNNTDESRNFNGIIINFKNRYATINNENLNLTPKEFELLIYFSKHAGQTLSRDKIIEDLWGKNTLYRWSRSLDVHIQNLRQKIEQNPKNPSIIKTVSGIGYKIKKD